MFLHELPIGECARIVRVHGSGELRRRLLDMGLTPGTIVKLLRTAPLGDPMQLCLRGYKLSLRQEAAMDIEIEPHSWGLGTCTRACAYRSQDCPARGEDSVYDKPERKGRKRRWGRKD